MSDKELTHDEIHALQAELPPPMSPMRSAMQFHPEAVKAQFEANVAREALAKDEDLKPDTENK